MRRASQARKWTYAKGAYATRAGLETRAMDACACAVVLACWVLNVAVEAGLMATTT